MSPTEIQLAGFFWGLLVGTIPATGAVAYYCWRHEALVQ